MAQRPSTENRSGPYVSSPTKRNRSKMEGLDHSGCRCKFGRSGGRYPLCHTSKENMPSNPGIFSAPTCTQEIDFLLEGDGIKLIICQANDNPKYTDEEKRNITGEDIENLLLWNLTVPHSNEAFNANVLIIKNFYHEGRDSTDFLVVYPTFHTIFAIEIKRSFLESSLAKASQQHDKLLKFLKHRFDSCNVIEDWDLFKITCFWFGNEKLRETIANNPKCSQNCPDWIMGGVPFEFADRFKEALESQKESMVSKGDKEFLASIMSPTLNEKVNLEIVEQGSSKKIGPIVAKLLNDTDSALQKLDESQKECVRKDISKAKIRFNL